MNANQSIYQKRVKLFSLVKELQNVSRACREMGVSRQYFYELRKAYQQQGEEALKEKNRKKPNLKNRVAPEIEKVVISYADQFPAYGQVRTANELRQKGVLISSGGVRSIWKRHGLKRGQKELSKAG